MKQTIFRRRMTLAIAGAAFGLSVLAGCASTGSDPGADKAPQQSWLKLQQTEKRFAIFTNSPPEPAEGGIATFRMVYVYMPETVQHEGRYVGWQEYRAMTVNCEADTVRVGPRTRYAPDNSVMMSDDDQEFAPIIGPAVRRAAAISCNSEVPADAVLLKDGPDWIEAARRHIAANDPT